MTGCRVTPRGASSSRTFPRATLAAASLAAALLAAWSDAPAATAPPAPRAPIVREGCKPLAPIDVSFTTSQRVAGRVDLELSISPRRPLEDVRWQLELHGTLAVLGGETSGVLDADSASAAITLLAPEDGVHKTAELHVSGIMEGSDGSAVRFDEPIATSRMLEWDRPESFTPQVMVPDALTGESRAVSVVPSSWRSGSDAVASLPETSDGSAEGAGSFLVTGTFLYEDKGWAYGGWSGVDPVLPVRRADVTVVDDLTGTVLGSGSTDQNGAFAVACTASGPVDIVVMCECDSGLDTSFQRIRVTPYSNIDYAVIGPVFQAHDSTSDLDVGTVTALKMLVGLNESNPFNIFDVSVDAWEYLLGPDLQAGLAPDVIKHIYPNGPKTWANPTGGWIGDDDGYDDAVILHEVGHVAQFQYSDLDTLGASHTFGQSDQDPRTSFTEGYATFFAGMVLEQLGRRPMYVDSKGSVQNKGWQLRMQHETAQPYTAGTKGAADETAVACMLFDLHDDTLTPDATPGVDDDPFDGSVLVEGKEPAAAFWEVFIGPVKEAFLNTHNDTWDGWIATHTIDPQDDLLQQVLTSFEQNFFEDAQEPDDNPLLAAPTPPSATSMWHGPFTLYRTDDVSLAPGIGDADWFAHDLVQGSVVNFQTRYPGDSPDADTQADPMIEIFTPLNELVFFDNDSGKGRNAKVTNFPVWQTGTWRTRVTSQNSLLRRYGSYEYSVLYVFENHLPVIDAGPIASPVEIKDDETTMLSAVASDVDAGQVLSYGWAPLDGGSIVGTGSSVTFVPPVVSVATNVQVQLTVLDDLGAASDPAIVQLLVQPSVGGVCSEVATATMGGHGKAGLFGVPILEPIGIPIVPSKQFALRVGNAHPGLSGVLVLGFGMLGAPFDEGTLYPLPDIQVPLTVDAGGGAVVPFVLPSIPGLCGMEIVAQALMVADPGAAGSKQTAQTNFVALTLGD